MKHLTVKLERPINKIQEDINKVILRRSLQGTKGVYTARDRFNMKRFDYQEDVLSKELEETKDNLEKKRLLVEARNARLRSSYLRT